MQENTLNRKVYKDSSLIFVNRFFGTVSMILVTYFYAHRLSPDAYGHYQNFWVQFYAFNAVAGLGLASFVFTYSANAIRTIISNTKIQHFAIFGLLLLGVSLSFGWLQIRAGNIFILSFLFIMLNTISIIAESLMIVFRNFKSLIFINIGYFLAFLGVHFTALKQPVFDFNKLLSFIIAAIFIKLILMVFSLKKNKEKTIAAETEILENSRYKKLWLHLYVFDMVQILMSMADKFLITLIVDKSTSAIYQNGSFAIPFLPVIFSAVSSASLLHFSTTHKNVEQEIAILKNLGRTLSNFAFPVFFFFLFFSTEFIQFFFSEKYNASIPIFIISLFTLPIRSFNFTILFQKHEKGAIINMGMLVDVFTTLILVFPLYHFLGLRGLALSFVLGTFAQAGFYLFHTQKLLQHSLLKILPLRNWLIKFCLFGVLMFCLHHVTTTFFTDLPAMLITIVIVGLAMLLTIGKELKLNLKKA